MKEFVHLHVHSEFSLLDGLSRLPDLAARACELNMPALALTDHGVMYGAIDFYRACKDVGVKPIIGIEAYLTPIGRSMEDKEPGVDDKRFHLLLLAQNEVGYKNLLKIASDSQLRGFYYKPRIDREYLAAHADGLICTTGCMSGEVPALLALGKEDSARARLEWYIDLFGTERFFVELQEHDIPELTRVNGRLVRWADEYGLRMVAANDVHYVRAEDAAPHDVLLCIQTGSLVADRNRMRMDGDSYYLKSYEEMERLFAEWPESLANTLLVAEMCEVDLEPKGYHLPPFDVPGGFTPESYLRHLCEKGLRERYGPGRADSPQVRDRLEHELKIIHDMGFDTYFLIVWDLCEFARGRDIWWNVRGSGAGSIVAYSMGITNLDPLANHLLFERFLNPGRVTMPDIDLDYPDDRREEMIRYTIEKYGAEQVAQIITFGTMGARAAIRDVGRALDIPLPEVDRVAKLVPFGPKVKLSHALEASPELKEQYEGKDYIKGLLDTAMHLEGVSRHASTHAAGVIVADRPLVEYTPLHRHTKGAEGSITQYTMEVLESIGLLKVDFLGLSTLTIMRKACDLIRERQGISLNLDDIPVEDGKAFELLSGGNVTGIFQVESAGMRHVLTTMRPSKFEHIVATISLYRPGPMEYIDTYINRMHGKEKVQYHHEALEPILAETYGIIVYQEQIMQIASELFGYTPGDADLMRRAVGKKKKEALLEHREKFLEGARARDISEAAAGKIFDDIEFFARYGFNKAHAADYAVITCQTAYLKAHYPVEYMTALLTVERNNTEKVGMLIAEARSMDIEVLAPDVNRSCSDFVIEEKGGKPAIRYGLGAVKNVGEGQIEVIMAARDEGGPFADVDDFCRRVDLRQVNRRALESLVKVGALESLGGTREQLLAIIDRMMSLSSQSHHDASVGQLSMFEFGGFDAPAIGSILHPLPEVEEVGRREKLGWEKELVGVYVSEHPMQSLMPVLRDTVTCFSGELEESMNGRRVVVAGVVASVRQIYTKKNDLMAFVELEDVQGIFDVTVFPRTYEQHRELLQPEKLVIVKGKVDLRNDRLSIICDSVETDFERYRVAGEPDRVPATRARHVKVILKRAYDLEADKRRIKEVCDIVAAYGGEDDFTMYVERGAGRIRVDFPSLKTRHCVELEQRLRGLLGAGMVHVE